MEKEKYYVQIHYSRVYEALEMIKGVEYNHPRNSEEVKKQIKDTAQKYDMI